MILFESFQMVEIFLILFKWETFSFNIKCVCKLQMHAEDHFALGLETFTALSSQMWILITFMRTFTCSFCSFEYLLVMQRNFYVHWIAMQRQALSNRLPWRSLGETVWVRHFMHQTIVFGHIAALKAIVQIITMHLESIKEFQVTFLVPTFSTFFIQHILWNNRKSTNMQKCICYEILNMQV